MNIILIAAPAAGKGTESEKLISEYNLAHISTGDLLREEIKKDGPLKEEIQSKMASGELVSDDIILKLIENKIKDKECANGYILDGFPRNIAQAKKYDEMLQKNNIDPGYVFVIDIDKEKAKQRIVGRRSCPNCGRIYNTIFELTKPKVEGICDDCKVELVKRSDDNEEAFENRYKVYLEQTAPLIEFYNDKGILYHIDGNTDKNYTHNQIKEILEK